MDMQQSTITSPVFERYWNHPFFQYDDQLRPQSWCSIEFRRATMDMQQSTFASTEFWSYCNDPFFEYNDGEKSWVLFLSFIQQLRKFFQRNWGQFWTTDRILPRDDGHVTISLCFEASCLLNTPNFVTFLLLSVSEVSVSLCF